MTRHSSLAKTGSKYPSQRSQHLHASELHLALGFPQGLLLRNLGCRMITHMLVLTPQECICTGSQQPGREHMSTGSLLGSPPEMGSGPARLVRPRSYWRGLWRWGREQLAGWGRPAAGGRQSRGHMHLHTVLGNQWKTLNEFHIMTPHNVNLRNCKLLCKICSPCISWCSKWHFNFGIWVNTIPTSTIHLMIGNICS